MRTEIFRTAVDVPDGTYDGKWSGYRVAFECNGETLTAETDNGVRGINVSCSVTVKDNQVVSVKAK